MVCSAMELPPTPMTRIVMRAMASPTKMELVKMRGLANDSLAIPLSSFSGSASTSSTSTSISLPLASGTISMAEPSIVELALECTTLSQPPNGDFVVPQTSASILDSISIACERIEPSSSCHTSNTRSWRTSAAYWNFLMLMEAAMSAMDSYIWIWDPFWNMSSVSCDSSTSKMACVPSVAIVRATPGLIRVTAPSRSRSMFCGSVTYSPRPFRIKTPSQM
ncbi:hypothetical protein HBH70_183980 [Parastagonospora nodorum]|nr:hypothetical protein HBH53_212240 [Parastagonospora nodorum]KAH4208432.1 hypothetical protein HBI95_090550 [Parastagonospora nodorum]KAH4291692.1 hypothetical protein HBI01_187030 [Parastagonospora nodorum]KAH4292649.1 hypothetical protein HBI02_190300 [Parastagonospora nodorum]KAH4323386.1 hypothetical protein HBI00_185450 [Parastagonospora nodorum]